MDLSSQLDSLLREHSFLLQRIEEERESVLHCQQELENAQEAQRIAQEVAERVQNTVHRRIASLVTRCLHTVFGEDSYTFDIDFIKSRGKTEAKLSFLHNGHALDPLDSTGGGHVDVASFALRIICLLLTQPRKRRLLCLDEIGKFINGEEYQHKFAQLLQTLCEELQFQIILCSDDDWLRIGKVIEV